MEENFSTFNSVYFNSSNNGNGINNNNINSSNCNNNNNSNSKLLSIQQFINVNSLNKIYFNFLIITSLSYFN